MRTAGEGLGEIESRDRGRSQRQGSTRVRGVQILKKQRVDELSLTTLMHLEAAKQKETSCASLPFRAWFEKPMVFVTFYTVAGTSRHSSMRLHGAFDIKEVRGRTLGVKLSNQFSKVRHFS